jgi:methyl-accepting chemotaxis protein
MTSRMKLSTKLIGSVGTILGLAVLLGACSSLVIRGLSHSMDYAVNVAAQRRLTAQEIYGTALKMQSLDRAIMLRAIMQQGAGTDDLKQTYGDTAAAGRKSLAQYQAMMEDSTDRASFDRVRSAFEDLANAHLELVQFMEKQQFDQVQKVADERVMPRAEAVTTEAKQLVQHDMARMQTASDEAKSKSSTGQWMVAIFTMVCLAVGAAIVAIVRRITSALRDLASTMSEGASQVAAAATQVAAVSQSLAQASSEQAASLEETSASGHDLASMTRKNVEHTQRASESVTETDRQVKVANATIERMVGSMQEINASSSKISKIIKVIDEIAFQTNILALNAAVEAARAGEAGMGFAVVADEVRNLAQRCAQAAKDTATLIEESIHTANEGSEQLNRVVEAIQGINQQATKVKEIVENVNSRSQEQSRSIEQISAAVAQMQKITQNTAASAEQGASTSQQMSCHADTVRNAVGQLYALVGGNDEMAPKPVRAPAPVTAPRPVSQAPKFVKPFPSHTGRNHEPKPMAAPLPHAEQEFPLDDSEFVKF